MVDGPETKQPTKSPVDTTADHIKEQKNSGHVDQAAKTLHDDFVTYSQAHPGETQQYWSQMEQKLGKDTLQQLSLVYGRENFDVINRNNRDTTNPDKLTDKVISIDQGAPGRTTPTESQYAAQMDGYLRDALKGNHDWSHWFGKASDVSVGQLNDRISQIQNGDQGRVIANDLAKGLDHQDPQGKTLLDRMGGNKHFVSDQDMQRAKQDVDQGKGGYTADEQKTIQNLWKASQADSDSPEGLAYKSLGDPKKGNYITGDTVKKVQADAKAAGIGTDKGPDTQPAATDDAATKERKADAANLAGHLNAGDVPLGDMGMKGPNDPVQKANVDAKLAELRAKGAVSWSDGDKKEVDALDKLSKHWDEISKQPGGSNKPGEITSAQIQKWAQENGTEFQGFKAPTATPPVEQPPQGRPDADILKAAQGQETKFPLDPKKPLYDQAAAELHRREPDKQHSPLQIRQELERIGEQNGWVKTKDEAAKGSAEDKRIRKGWDDYVHDGQTSHLDKGLNAKMRGGMDVKTTQDWNSLTDDQKKSRLGAEVAKDIPDKKANTDDIHLTDDQKKALGPDAAGNIARYEPQKVVDYLKAQKQPLSADQETALRNDAKTQADIDAQRQTDIQARVDKIMQAQKPADAPAETPDQKATAVVKGFGVAFSKSDEGNLQKLTDSMFPKGQLDANSLKATMDNKELMGMFKEPKQQEALNALQELLKAGGAIRLDEFKKMLGST